MRARLYRFRDEQWKERGTGNFKLMRHKESKKIRALMRQEKTLKPVANFLSKILLIYIFSVSESPLCDLVPMKSNDKAYIWSANDFSEEEQKLEKLCIRLQNAESININFKLFLQILKSSRRHLRLPKHLTSYLRMEKLRNL